MTRTTRDLCQTDWEDAHPGEYAPFVLRYGICAHCGDDTLVSRSVIADETWYCPKVCARFAAYGDCEHRDGAR